MGGGFAHHPPASEDPMRRLMSCFLVSALVAGRLTAQIVDSLLPPAEELRRFEATLARKPVALEHSASSRDQLIHRFARALSIRDSVALRQMVISREEFATLYYPTSMYAKPPYYQKPGLVWFQMENTSYQGLTRLLARDGGKTLTIQSSHCPSPPVRQGRNQIWKECLVSTKAESTRSRKLFGSIVERGGRFKFLTYATEY